MALRYFSWMLLAALPCVYADMAFGQAYPNKSIRIVTSPAGGTADFVGRLLALGITGPLGQSVVVENRTTSVIDEIVSKAAPDGYTLALVGQGFWISPLLTKTPYDPVRDFTPITLINRSPNVLVAHPALPAKSVRELIALAKAKPGALNYASTASGSGAHLAAELFKAMAGVNIVQVNYKGGGPAVSALVGGEVQLMFAVAATVMPNIKSGKLSALAVSSAQPSALFPGLPTIAGSGVPGYESVSMQSMLAPAKTPAPVINRLNQEMVRVIRSADIQEKFLNGGAEAVGSSPAELAATAKAEMARMGKVIKDAGIRIE